MRAFVCAVSLLAAAHGCAASAQELFAYPTQGQGEDQQNRDRYECHIWAVKQTGFDPTRASADVAAPPPPPQYDAPQGGLLRGATRGAAIGAVGGAIGGDAGKGAAIGAGTGALIGGIRRRESVRQQQYKEQQYQQQVATAQSSQSAAQAGRRDSYNRALAACLQGRGYTVS